MSRATKLTTAQAKAIYTYRGAEYRGLSAMGRALAAGDFAAADRMLAEQQLADAARNARTDRAYSLAVLGCNAVAAGREWSWL